MSERAPARTLGIEEELLLVDPGTRAVSPRSNQVIKRFLEHGPGRAEGVTIPATDELDQELFLHQLETRTDPTSNLDDLRRQVVRARGNAFAAAEATGLVTVASGTIPIPGDEPRVTRNDRYHDMVDTYGEVAAAGVTCGMHVHLGVADDVEGVELVDTLGPWLPLFLALSANSPYAEGRDTRYASWRNQLWSRWPSAGPTDHFGTPERYHELGRRLIASGAARDTGMLYYDVRLSEAHPTVEVRVFDVCADPDDAVLAAALLRAIADAPHLRPSEEQAALWPVRMRRAAAWRASRYGLADTLLDPRTGELRPATALLRELVDLVREQLDASGDLAFVEQRVDAVLAGGGGAVRQRAAFERTGSLDAVVDDLVERTNADAGA